MTLIRPTLSGVLEDIHRDADAKLAGIEARLQRGLVHVLLTAQAGGIHGLYAYLQRIADDRFPQSARGDALDVLGEIRGVVRGTATFASGWIGAAGASPGTIPLGARFRTADGREYERQGSGTLPDGSTTTIGTGTVSNATLGLGGTGWNVPVRAVESGTASNVIAGTALLFVSPISGFPSQLDVTVGIAGAVDVETDAAFRARILDAWQAPPQGGNVADWRRWALDSSTPSDPITRAFVEPPALATPPTVSSNVVTVYIVDDGGGFPAPQPPSPSATAISNAEAYIDARRPATSARDIRAPAFLAIAPEISINPDTPETRAAIENELDAWLQDNARPGEEIPISLLRAVISNAAGGADATLVSPTVNVTPASDALVYRGTVTWS